MRETLRLVVVVFVVFGWGVLVDPGYAEGRTLYALGVASGVIAFMVYTLLERSARNDHG